MIPSKIRPKRFHITRDEIVAFFNSQKDKKITFNIEEEEWLNQDRIDACRCWSADGPIP
jgi:hypothetical protein